MIGFELGVLGLLILFAFEAISGRLRDDPPEDWTSWETWDWPNDFRDWDFEEDGR